MNAVLRFPAAPEPESRKTELVFNFRQKPVLSKFEKTEAQRLLLTAQRVDHGMKALTLFVDSHRSDTAAAGIETIAIEIGSEREALGDILDALEDGVESGDGVQLSEGSLELLRRLEKLLAEALSNISRFQGASPPARMGAIESGMSDLLIPALFFGLIAISVIMIAAWAPKK